MFLPLLIGCSLGFSQNATVDDVDTTPTRIDALDPAVGPPSGGTEVTITGAGFVGDVEVTFGGLPADLTVIDDGTLVAVTPRAGTEVTVNVVVTSANGVATKGGAFAYQRGTSTGGDDTGGLGDDTGGLDTDTTDTTPSPYAGMTGGYLQLRSMLYACPACFNMADSAAQSVSAEAVFHTPVDGSWLDALPAEGTCVRDPSPSDLASAYLDAGASLTLASGEHSIRLSATTDSSGTSYAASGLGGADFVPGAQYDLTAEGGVDLSAFTLPSALRTPDAFTSVTPTAMVSSSTSDGFTTTFGTSGTTVTWEPSGSTGIVVLELYAYAEAGLVGSTTCRTTDSGSFTVPGTAVADWSAGYPLTVHLTKWQVGVATLPDGSDLEVVGSYDLVGTGRVGN